MSSLINIPANALEVIEKLESQGYEAYVVGGCVRDSLMGITPLDWDICSNASPQESLKVFSRYHCIKTGLQHGTITVMVNKEAIELTTYRLDGSYSDNRRPDAVNFVQDLKEDLARRDFTINAMAYRPSSGLVDCYGGQEDLAARRLRCVGDARTRFEEDALRILRALRFASRFELNIEESTALAMRQCRELLANVSEERIYKELKGILVGKGARSMMMDFPEIFISILPELAPMIDFEQHNQHHIYTVWEHSVHCVQNIPAEPCLRLAALFHDISKPECFTRDEAGIGHFIGHAQVGARLCKKILGRLKSDNATIDCVHSLVLAHDNSFPHTRAGMRRLIGKLGETCIRQLMLLKRADTMAQSNYQRAEKAQLIDNAESLLAEVLLQLSCFNIRDLSINGRELMALGLQAGPQIRVILESLLAEVQEEQLSNDIDSLRQRARQLIERA